MLKNISLNSGYLLKICTLIIMETKQNELIIKNEKLYYSKLKFKHLKFINVDKIMFCKADGSYTNVYLINDKSFIISQRIKIINELLATSIFVRCHKSYIVNINYIIDFSSRKPFWVMLSNGEKVIVSERKRKATINKIFYKNN